MAAEVSLALVDFALLRMFKDTVPPIGPFFYGQERRGAFTTEATSTFTYTPQTVPVAEAVVEEQERLAAVASDAEKRGEAGGAAARQVELAVPTAPMAAAEATPPPPAESPVSLATGVEESGKKLADVNRSAGALGDQLRRKTPAHALNRAWGVLQLEDKKAGADKTKSDLSYFGYLAADAPVGCQGPRRGVKIGPAPSAGIRGNRLLES